MNRIDIAHQVSLTLGDSAESFDIDGIVDDLIAAHDGDLDSIDDFDSQSYWAIVETHDTGAQAEEKAEKAHADYLKVEAAYKQATVARQVAFAQAIDAMGRGGNAILSRKIGLAAPTVKSIADRGREFLAAEFTAWLTTQPNITLNGEFCEISIVEDTAGGTEPLPATPLPVPVGGEDQDAQEEAEAVLSAAGWETAGDWEQTDHGYSVKVARTDLA
ncbi:hypothetical protein [Streptomyces sp. C1-2]|uniref:hypothetical protein n=1 Tax=Streptomyces sp. C1-2 TaxID=2720022 RepID=UPI0014327A40|nr:hypothetical protein [Streptomyces sp. C1-2]NJP70055.1 hypothetical protein [Streptomyces sp. C1-2]